MLSKLNELRDRAMRDIDAASDAKELEEVRIRFLGRKDGELTNILGGLGALAPADKPIVGKRANEIKREIEAAIDASRQTFGGGDGEQAVDLTLPGRKPPRGHLHPLTRTLRAIERIFGQLGYTIATGPQVETDYYNFEALNLPPDHPARDMQDTFYLHDGLLLRTHTSPVQIRTMEKMQPPVRIIAPGVVYRREDEDASHLAQFMQFEGLAVDEGITFGDLKGTLQVFVHAFFGPEIGVRFRPSFFPFTEPSAEMDIQCVACIGQGCRTCSYTGWLEILGCGMVDPAVFGFVGYDPEKYTGFAFGCGIERLAILQYGMNDLRLFYENDVRLLGQF